MMTRVHLLFFYSNNFQKLILVSDRYVKNMHVAEEIVQDMFLKIWEDKELLLYVNSVKAYLYRSVVNASINYINRQKNIEKHHLKIAEHLTDDDIDIINEQNELIVLLYNEIEQLPEKCQKVFKLSRLEGLKYRDIAAELSISEKTVENHMSNALRLLRLRVIHNIHEEDPKSKAKYFSLLSLFLY
ncbi:RNA polymerase sigma-70 factor [Pedobacter lusitanus]|uniref:RNA polymerase sigma-70 factor n=1 Tax=Pedobacter lusitanus TaxID=1503925 RepID=UPI000AA31307|nr:RNA polymerase sigma-70 factor [Pedobacter lusitanus]